MRCFDPSCKRAAEVVVHIDSLAVLACLTDGIRLARHLHGRVVLLGRPGEELTLHPRGA
ncbi:hypothetical protein [Salana multivorans]|uniref:hypothetical protein n=1 Tax=Salana multivorans TaxID=120377 RepID=UPI0024920C22|nr:hypothetical protein [Salana multivorans]